jgi:hypothetical protein
VLKYRNVGNKPLLAQAALGLKAMPKWVWAFLNPRAYHASSINPIEFWTA